MRRFLAALANHAVLKVRCVAGADDLINCSIESTVSQFSGRLEERRFEHDKLDDEYDRRNFCTNEPPNLLTYEHLFTC